MKRLAVLAALTLAVGLLASPALAQAPQPSKPVDLERFYSGQWLEIGRLPMKLTDGCVAGATRLCQGRQGPASPCVTPAATRPRRARRRPIEGKGRIMDPGTNAKLKVSYPFFITWEYWVLDHADDYSWFISADPKFEKLLDLHPQAADPGRA